MGIIGNKREQKIFAGLTDKQRRFVLEYAADLNATRAAREVGYRHENVMRAKLLNEPKIQKALLAVLKPQLDELKATTTNILRQLTRFSFYDVAEFYDKDGNLAVSPKDLPEAVRQCIVGWKVRRKFYKDGELSEEIIDVKLVDKLAAVSKVAEYLKLIDPETTTNVNVTFDWNAFYRRATTPVVDTLSSKIKEVTDGRPCADANGDSGDRHDSTSIS